MVYDMEANYDATLAWQEYFVKRDNSLAVRAITKCLDSVSQNSCVYFHIVFGFCLVSLYCLGVVGCEAEVCWLLCSAPLHRLVYPKRKAKQKIYRDSNPFRTRILDKKNSLKLFNTIRAKINAKDTNVATSFSSFQYLDDDLNEGLFIFNA